MNFLTMQLEYLPCYQNNTSQYIVLVSKELEKEPATSKKQRIYQKREKLQINTCLKRNLKRKKTTSKKQGFYQKLEKLQIHTCLEGILKGKNNQQKALILPKTRNASNQYLLKRNCERKKQQAKSTDSTKS